MANRGVVLRELDCTNYIALNCILYWLTAHYICSVIKTSSRIAYKPESHENNNLPFLLCDGWTCPLLPHRVRSSWTSLHIMYTCKVFELAANCYQALVNLLLWQYVTPLSQRPASAAGFIYTHQRGSVTISDAVSLMAWWYLHRTVSWTTVMIGLYLRSFIKGLFIFFHLVYCVVHCFVSDLAFELLKRYEYVALWCCITNVVCCVTCSIT